MSKIFARPLTKEYLVKHGVKDITEDCKVIFDDGRVLEKEKDFIKNKGYLCFNVYELDENGNRIRIPITRRYKYKGYEKFSNTHTYKKRTIYLHRAMWAWFNDEIPEGILSIDHISNKHNTLYDNRLENLQLLSQGEHARKDKPLSTRELKCNMTLPLSYYEEKLNTYLNKYNNAKDQKEKSTLRTRIYEGKAKIRYWKNHEEEYLKNEENKAIKAKALKVQKERTKDLKQYQKIVDEARELYKQDPSSDNNYNWRLAVDNYNEFVKNNPFKTQKQLFAELDSDNKRN